VGIEGDSDNRRFSESTRTQIQFIKLISKTYVKQKI